MSYVSNSAETPPPSKDDPYLLGFDEENAGDALRSLSSETAREIVTLLQENPSTAPDVAASLDTSLQNVHYHLDRLQDADVVHDVGTVYSEKGREMAVYESAGSPILLVGGDATDRERLADHLSELLGALGIVALTSVAVQRTVHQSGTPSPAAAGEVGALLPPGMIAFVAGVGIVSLLIWIRSLGRR